MQPAVQEARPPYVTFEKRAIEDRAASETNGHYTSKDIDYVIITPQGSKDRIERVTSEWLTYLDDQVKQQRFPEEWARAYREGYARWVKDQLPDITGTSIQNWPPASPAMAKNMLTWNVRTVEDLAAANEETLSRLGMGARDLKRRAIEWLASADGIGKTSERMASLEGKIETQDKQIKNLMETNALLQQQLSSVLQGQLIGRQPQEGVDGNGVELHDLVDTSETPSMKRL